MSEKPYVLVVDDDRAALILMQRYLTSLGYEFQGALSGKEALEILRADPGKAGLVFLDIAMPDMNGQEVCSIIRADPELENIPIVALTAIAEPQLLGEASKAGLNGIVLKPFTRDNLEKALAEYFRLPAS